MKKEIEKDTECLVTAAVEAYDLNMHDALEGSVKTCNMDFETFLVTESMVKGGDIILSADMMLYMEAVKFWMRGNLDWHFETDRYKNYQLVH